MFYLALQAALPRYTDYNNHVPPAARPSPPCGPSLDPRHHGDGCGPSTGPAPQERCAIRSARADIGARGERRAALTQVMANTTMGRCRWELATTSVKNCAGCAGELLHVWTRETVGGLGSGGEGPLWGGSSGAVLLPQAVPLFSKHHSTHASWLLWLMMV